MITSARKVNELVALRSYPLFLKFCEGKIMLHSTSEFLPKVISNFQLSKGITLSCSVYKEPAYFGKINISSFAMLAPPKEKVALFQTLS